MGETRKGIKECPFCHEPVGARALRCKSCDKDIPVKEPVPKPKDRVNLETAIQVVKGMGGVEQLKKALDEYVRVVAPINRLGGMKRARAVLEQLEAIKSL